VKKDAFSFFEVMVILAIIGFIFIVCVPIVTRASATKINNARYFEAYRALMEGAQLAKQNIPSHDFTILRQELSNMGTCDYFAQLFSLSDGEDGLELAWCPGKKYISDASYMTNGLCNACTVIPANEPCPLDSTGNRHMYADENCSGETADSTVGIGTKYCRMVPERAFLYKGCDDGSVKLTDYAEQDRKTFLANGARLTAPYPFVYRVPDISPIGTTATTPVSIYNDETDFDNPDIKGNFTTVNGLTFYGLERYPAQDSCNVIDQTVTWKKRGDVDFSLAGYTKCNVFRDVYIDTNGKSANKKPRCTGFPAPYNAGTPDAMFGGSTSNENTLKCLKERFGVYKFRLYNDGHIEPLTNVNTQVGQLTFKLYFVKNDRVVEADKAFATYNDARLFVIGSGAGHAYKYYDSTKGTFVTSTDRTFVSWNDGTLSIPTSLGSPCESNSNFKKYKCEIVPIIPTVKGTQLTKH